MLGKVAGVSMSRRQYILMLRKKRKKTFTLKASGLAVRGISGQFIGGHLFFIMACLNPRDE